MSTPRRWIGEVMVQRHSFLNSTLDGGEWSNSGPERFTPPHPREKTPIL